MRTDDYKTIKTSATGIYKDKGSKFIAISRYVASEEEFKVFLEETKKEYYDARHHCYAYRLDPENERTRSNDDGEPTGSAGKPILNQLLSHGLYNVMVVVIRYFGGTKLGVSGLINAYKISTKDVIDEAEIKIKHISNVYTLHFEYPKLNDVMRIIKEEKISIIQQDFSISCFIKIEIKKSQLNKSFFRLDNLYGLEIKPLENS